MIVSRVDASYITYSIETGRSLIEGKWFQNGDNDVWADVWHSIPNRRQLYFRISSSQSADVLFIVIHYQKQRFFSYKDINFFI